MDNYLKILEDWRNNNLRKERPFINFTFDNKDLFLQRILAFPTKDREEVIDPNITEEQEEESRKPYVENSFNNIKEVLDIILENKEDIFIVHVNYNEYNEGAYFNEVTDDCKFLLKRFDHIFEQGEREFLGSCKFQNLLEIIYASITSDFPEVYETMEEYRSSVVGPQLLIQIPKQELYLYIYDCRGGILVSKNNDKTLLRDLISKVDKKLLNEYWYEKMIESVSE